MLERYTQLLATSQYFKFNRMKEFYHYTLEKNVEKIRALGIYSGGSHFTTTEYYNAFEAGQKLGVQPHYIDCVLKFSDDGLFKSDGTVPSTGRFIGGGNHYRHPSRPKPIAVRKITERNWRNF